MKRIILLFLLFRCAVASAGVDFDGTDDYINCGSGSSLQPANLSISLWTKKTADKDPAKMTLLEIPYNNEGSPPFASYAIIYDRNSANELELFLGHSAVSFAAYGTTGGTLTDGEWYHIAVTFNDATKAIKFYLNTNIILDTTASGSIFYSGTDSLFIAADTPATGEPYYGQINELAIWNTVLSQTDVDLLYSKVKRMPLQIKPANLVGYWPLDDICDGCDLAGETFLDMSGNGNTGTGYDADTSGGQGEAEYLLTYPRRK